MNIKKQWSIMMSHNLSQGLTQTCSLLNGKRFRGRALTGVLFLLFVVPVTLFGQTVSLPLEIRQDATRYNFQSINGVPLSAIKNTPEGSDGRLNPEEILLKPVTPNQFSSMVSYGAALSTTNKVGSATVQLLQAQVGAPFLSRTATSMFGSVISPPDVNYSGTLLSTNDLVTASYWSAEPFSTNDHQGEGYYWSPHAEKVYASQSGPISITWRKAVPFSESNLPVDYVNDLGDSNFHTNGASIYLLKTVSYIVSSSPAQTPRKMYWTEKSFLKTGKPISIPSARVGAVNIVYNQTFAKTVNNEYSAIGDTSIATNGLKEVRTLWYDQQQGFMYAYNQEGRILVELLGDFQDDNVTRKPLGIEVVDVSKQPLPVDIAVDLGDRITPFLGSLDTLTPEPVLQAVGAGFAYRHAREGSDTVEFYAQKKTENLNDYLVHWMEAGTEGILWPKEFSRYSFDWPTDITHYSHYLRPVARSDEEAQETAVQLSAENVPTIAYQDPLDQPRAKLTADSNFYTWLDANQPVHRTLLRFTSGSHIAFERVYSWFDETLKNGRLEGTLATELSAYSDYAAAYATYLENGGSSSVLPSFWPEEMSSPRSVFSTVEVGDRIEAPGDENESGTHDCVGHINLNGANQNNNLYNVNAYIDPLSNSFDVAKSSSIIPVNAIPGRDTLDVWWFRKNSVNAGSNAGDQSKGFETIYWPSIIGHYKIAWPAAPREIVMASNKGGGTLSSLEAKGTIYVQNDSDLHGYNPNEEHAIMQGGTPYATRDDLNITDGVNYSSEPYVLVEYTDADGRLSMSPFKVLREKPEEGLVFDYLATAGQVLQPPAPLMFLPKPVTNSVNYNTEPLQDSGDMPVHWDSAVHTNHYDHYQRFTYRDRNDDFWVYRGPHVGRPELEVGSYDVGSRTFGALVNGRALVDQPFRYTVHASRQSQYLRMTAENLPDWLTLDHLTILGTPTTNDVEESTTISLILSDPYDGLSITNDLMLTVSTNGAAITQTELRITSTNPNTATVGAFTNRPPYLAHSPTSMNSFTMQYYYKTLANFAWPGFENPPQTGSIVPFLRAQGADKSFVGVADSTTNALKIVYRPVWPVKDPKDSTKSLPTLRYGATLAESTAGLPGIRNWLTASVLYQQSIAADMTTEAYSAVLFDPTVVKISDLEKYAMDAIPSGIKTENYQGIVYFPNLPPHLGKRFYFDPNRGANGSLVLKGEYKKETLGESYHQLNVLRGKDLEAVRALCPEGDSERSKWVGAINALAVAVETFYENPAQPGTYMADPDRTELVGVTDVVEIKNDNVPHDSYALSATGPGHGYLTLLENSGTAFTEPGDPVAMHIIKVGGEELERGELKIIAAENPLSELLTFQHSADLAGRSDEFEYEWKIGAPVDGFPPEIDREMSRYLPLINGADLPRHTLGGAGIQALSDNYVVMRYKAKQSDHPLYNQWSAWTKPALAEGWIKRVLAGINPFNQRISDLFGNQVNTDASIITQAGKRWEGDIALNLDTINDYGLIEIYETILRRGRQLSIEAGYNYGPANDALLLAAGYLSDLYMMLGNEGWADAANPTIGIGTADNTYGDIATSLFCFKGQQASLLDEELALLRGRDDVFQPGVEINPVYNRLIWNYTRGIDAGEVIYALNYNIQENPNQNPDGNINAEDAAHMYPQGHGDAYGHYLTSMKGYYSLLLNSNFDWVPRIEAVNILGKPVSVDYQDERKFAAAAAATARTGRQVFDLTWRKDFRSVKNVGWEHLADSRENTQRTFSTNEGDKHPVRHWGMDQWASRVGQGTYLNWVVGNSMLPAVDPDPDHEGIQKVDRTTVPELKELPTLAQGLQTALDNAEAGFSPLGVLADAMALDINPDLTEETHFEQVYARATQALNNALTAFDDAKDVTQLMRSEQDSLAGLQGQVAEQELAFKNAMIELYGTPYPDDKGPGKTWKQDYDGPDLLHYMYVETPELPFNELWNYPGDLTGEQTFNVSLADLPETWETNLELTGSDLSIESTFITYAIGPHGYLQKPLTWTGQRACPGRIQQAISLKIAARNKLMEAIYTHETAQKTLDRVLRVYKANDLSNTKIDGLNKAIYGFDTVVRNAENVKEVTCASLEAAKDVLDRSIEAATEALPSNIIAGLAAGGDATAPARGALKLTKSGGMLALDATQIVTDTAFRFLEESIFNINTGLEALISEHEGNIELRKASIELGNAFAEVQSLLWGINEALREYDDAQREVQTTIAEGDRIQLEQEVFRKRSAAVVQGYRTRDAAFRIFRNEKLERYKTLFDLASRYSLLAANAYDYETGLLGSDAGREFTQRIIQSRALGVVGDDGEPQFAGSNAGDPGLSSALAEMKADWNVVKTRLGFNNPDSYGTTASLRTENFRIKPGEQGDVKWKEVLHKSRVRDLLEDADVRRYCMQIGNDDGLPVPGLILTFRTTITDGYNLFGKPLAAYDHAYSASSFATKIFAAGVALDGYQGMNDPAANSDAGGTSPADPDLSFLDPEALAANPYVYLIPVGADSMRSPPLGDASGVRSWMVKDVAIPLPFNIGASGFSTAPLYQSNDSLAEPLFATRKHQAFRPISDAALFSSDLYSESEHTSSRLIGRSVWNSQWKLVIPGKTLLNNPEVGLDRLIQSLEDIKIHFVTYSYSGN